MISRGVSKGELFSYRKLWRSISLRGLDRDGYTAFAKYIDDVGERFTKALAFRTIGQSMANIQMFWKVPYLSEVGSGVYVHRMDKKIWDT